MSRSWLEIDREAISHNASALLASADGAQLCAVVKADGYGHGSVPVAQAALAGGATRLAVAQVDEGIPLRRAGIDVPIWVLSEPEPQEFEAVLALDLEPAVYTRAGIEAASIAVARLASSGSSETSRMAVHLKVNTGMNRVGAVPQDVVPLAQMIRQSPGLKLASVWTHCAVSDEPENPLTDIQMDRFAKVLAELDTAGLMPLLVHAANSGATIGFPRTHFDVVRCGIALYGLAPSAALADRVSSDLGLQPAMRWLTRVAMVKRLKAGDRVGYGQRGLIEKETTVVTLPVGYADGYRRATWRVPGSVLIGGKQRSIVGVVTMDQIVVAVGDDDVAVGDEAVLLGKQGSASITADDLAIGLGTINYEIICSPSSRVSRVYLPD